MCFYEAGRKGRLLELLAKLPRKRWAERDEDDYTLLQCACVGSNLDALKILVQSRLLDINARDDEGYTATHVASLFLQPCLLELLCAAGADLGVCSKDGNAPIDLAIKYEHEDGGETMRVLLANGVRLRTLREKRRRRITRDMIAFECGVIRCRSAATALLRVKKVGNLWRWDKFLLREMAYALWSTRYGEEWQN